jgi:hypothetical protein
MTEASLAEMRRGVNSIYTFIKSGEIYGELY